MKRNHQSAVVFIGGKFMRRAWIGLISSLFLLLAACGQLNTSPKASDNQSVPNTKVQALGIDDGLVGYWPFDAFNPTADLSGRGNIVTLASGLQLTTEVAPTTFANTRALLSTPTANNYATAPGKGIDNLTDYTVAFWLRVNSAATGTGDVLALGNRLVIQVRKLQSGQFILDVRYPLRVYPYPTEAVIESNGWNHVVVAIKGNVTDIYFNGQRVQNETYLAGSSGTPTGGIYFSSPTTPLNGILDDVRIYNRVLSTSEIAALPYNCNYSQGVGAGECQALVDLFHNTDGMKWTNHSNWLQNNTPCTWAGVLCTNGHVFALTLPQNNLSGELPASIGNLSELAVLQLYNNHLTGMLPAELGNLSKLQTLDLYGNQLGGQIPIALANLSKLTTLRLHNNQLHGPIPPQLANLNGLLTLDFGYNMLTAVDSRVLSFLNSKQPNWNITQTVPPTNVQANVASSTSITLTWTPVPYKEDGGYYDVLVSSKNGLYKSAGHTTDKKADTFTVNGLISGQNYSFSIRTFTPKHGDQQNDLLSDGSDPVAILLAVNHPPVVRNDSYTTALDTPLTVDAAHGILANDSDPDRNPLKLASISVSEAGAKLNLNPDGSFTFTPPVGFVGTVNYTYQVTDGNLTSNPATISFLVTSANPATLTIALQTQPQTNRQFNFSGTLGAFTLSNSVPTKTFPLSAGRLSISEQVPNGWVTSNMYCNPPTGTIVDLVQSKLDINTAGGTSITCTFVMQKTSTVSARVYRDTNGNGIRDIGEVMLPGWAITLQNTRTFQTQTQTTNSQGNASFTNVTPDSYKVCETPQNGWSTTQPRTNPPCYTLTVAPDQDIRVWFGNKTP